jgi:hypothetical protein
MVASTKNADEEPDHAAHEALRTIRAKVEEAFNEDQLDLLFPLIDDEFSAVMLGEQQYGDFMQLKADWDNRRTALFGAGKYELDLCPERSDILGSVAIAKGNAVHQVMAADGGWTEAESTWTAVCRKKGRKWKIVRIHASMGAVQHYDKKPGLGTNLLKGGLLGGAIVGALAAGLIKGRKSDDDS